jgi:hypothetical protein|tara:strand:+ start:2387 stop:3742 length:1356 start_codon:yes stop_codon:yes gene_type:complete
MCFYIACPDWSSATPTFEIGACSGEITLKDNVQLDFEGAASAGFHKTYQVAVNAVGTCGAACTTSITQPITVTNSNEAPTIDDVLYASVFLLPENSPSSLLSNGLLDATNGWSRPLVVHDPDASQRPYLSIVAGNSDQIFRTCGNDPPNGVRCSGTDFLIVVNDGSPEIDYETNANHELLIRAFDSDDADLYDDAQIYIDVTDLNESPVFSTISSIDRDISEDASVGDSVGIAVFASDVDGGDKGKVRYALCTSATCGNDGNVFSIDDTSGHIKVFGALDADGSKRSTYTLVVEAIDCEGGTAAGCVIPPSRVTPSISVLVTVLDENEAPTARRGVYNKIPVAENSPIGTVIPWIYEGQTNAATVTSLSGEILDEDASESFTFLLTPTRPAKNKFAITSNTGILSVASDQLNHDMPTKEFRVHVKVIDSGGLQLTNNAEGKVELNFYITGK